MKLKRKQKELLEYLIHEDGDQEKFLYEIRQVLLENGRVDMDVEQAIEALETIQDRLEKITERYNIEAI